MSRATDSSNRPAPRDSSAGSKEPSGAGIRLIVGLGNPGREYVQTRHNAGFWFVDALAMRHQGAFTATPKFFGDVAKVQIEAQPVWLLKPSTFMNRSGRAVAALAGFYRISPEQILVVHDELDLPPGQAKMKKGGGHAGHNGLKDIQAQLGSAQFWRLRLGIGHPRTLGLEQAVIDFVLHAPRREEQAAIDAQIEDTLAIVPDAVAGALDEATRRLHTRNAPVSVGPKTPSPTAPGPKTPQPKTP